MIVWVAGVPRPSDQFEILIHHLHIRPIALHPVCNGLQGLFEMDPVIAHHPTGDDRFLPLVLKFHLGCGNIELFMKAGQQGLEASALLFQRGAAGKAEMDG